MKYVFKYLQIPLSVILILVTIIFGAKDLIDVPKEEIPAEAIHVSYGKGIREHMNIFMPDHVQKGDDVNVLLVIHPGTWFLHNENLYNDNCIAAAKEGFVAVTIEFCQLQNGATLDHMMDDIDSGITYLKNYLTDEGYNAKHLIIASHSSGAELALEYAYSRHETCAIPIAFILENSGLTSFVDVDETDPKNIAMSYILASVLTETVMTPFNKEDIKEKLDSVSPLALVKPGVPPTIIVHGDQDQATPISNSEKLYAALQEAGVDSTFLIYEGADHYLGENYPEDNAKRAEVFFEYVEKYCK